MQVKIPTVPLTGICNYKAVTVEQYFNYNFWQGTGRHMAKTH